MMMTVSV